MIRRFRTVATCIRCGKLRAGITAQLPDQRAHVCDLCLPREDRSVAQVVEDLGGEVA